MKIYSCLYISKRILIFWVKRFFESRKLLHTPLNKSAHITKLLLLFFKQIISITVAYHNRKEYWALDRQWAIETQHNAIKHMRMWLRNGVKSVFLPLCNPPYTGKSNIYEWSKWEMISTRIALASSHNTANKAASKAMI